MASRPGTGIIWRTGWATSPAEKAIIAVLKSLRAEGRTVVAVHHDLATVTEYFDNVFLINTTKIAEGPVAEAFTAEALQATYGGRLATAQVDQLARALV